MQKHELIREYLKRFPDHGDLTIAKKIYAENSLLFKSAESVRSTIRAVKGKINYTYADKSMHKPKTYDTNPYRLPESDEQVRKPYHLPKANNNILLISDLHIPYHSISAITAALDYGKQENVNTIVINGDLIDFYQMSRFEKDPRKRSAKFEFDATKAFLQVLRSTFPNAQIYWVKGNHDVRYEHWLMSKAPEVFDDPYYRLEERLRLSEENIHLIGDKTLVKAGKLNIHHGHLFFRGFGSPISPAKTVYDKSFEDTICSHVHKKTEFSKVSLSGKLITCYTTGCLCELSPDYAPFGNSYVHGFAHIKVKDSGDFDLKNMTI
jgi:predicted phosphodiesterase